MQGYVAVQDGAFAESRKCFGEVEDWMASRKRRPGCSTLSWRTSWMCGAGSCCGGCSRTGWT
jgi:hypothetical protein